MCLVSYESWELILQFVSSGLMKLDETISYCWCAIVMSYEVVAMVATMVAMVAPL